MMCTLSRGLRVALIFVGIIFTYIVATRFLPAKLLIEVGDAFAVPMSFMASLVYFKEVWERDKDTLVMTRTDYIMIAIAGGWFTNGLDRGLRLWARLHDATILDGEAIGLFLFLLTFFASMHVEVASSGDTRKGIDGPKAMKLALVCGAILAGVAIWLEWT